MYISALKVRGFRDLAEFTARELPRVVRLRGPTPASTALGDGLELVFACLSHANLLGLIDRWQLLGTDEQATIDTIEGSPFPDQVSWTDREAARSLLPEGRSSRAISVDVELTLDPPLFQSLRELGSRDLDLLTALLHEPRFHLGVGGLFTNSHDAMALHIKRIAIGAQAFPTQGQERPSWLEPFLLLLQDRFQRHQTRPGFAQDVLEAATSRQDFGAYQKWCSALQPDGPQLRAARGPGGRPILLGDELPLRRWGSRTRRQAALAADVHLRGADILWAEDDDPWLDSTVEGLASPLEQIWRVCTEGEIDPEAGLEPQAGSIR